MSLDLLFLPFDVLLHSVLEGRKEWNKKDILRIFFPIPPFFFCLNVVVSNVKLLYNLCSDSSETFSPKKNLVQTTSPSLVRRRGLYRLRIKIVSSKPT